MSNATEKKQQEIEILKKVFGKNVNYTECEQPDFILHYDNGDKFGVEVTELYYDGVSARLKSEGYIEQLITKQAYRHKDDKKKLKVHKVKYYSQEKKKIINNLPMLFLPKYTVKDFANSLIATIQQKNNKLIKYNLEVSEHCILIIYDRENHFKNTLKEDIAKNLFFSEVSKIINESKFYDIFLITFIDNDEVYVSLKAYLLLSDCHLFFNFIRENDLVKRLDEIKKHPLLALSELLIKKYNYNVFIGEVANEDVDCRIVAYTGRYGIGLLFGKNDGFGIGIFDIYSLKSIEHIGQVQLDSENEFFTDEIYKLYETKTNGKIASIGFGFSVNNNPLTN